MGQRIPGLSPAVAEEVVTHAYLCVGAVGVFFDFVTDCFIASCVPSTSAFLAPDPAPFAEILSVEPSISSATITRMKMRTTATYAWEPS
jgi:hypothetical protein